jgi:hypothetical protein
MSSGIIFDWSLKGDNSIHQISNGCTLNNFYFLIIDLVYERERYGV